MKLPRVLIDTSNLHHGGGVQVAASFLNELGRLRQDPDWVTEHAWVRKVRVEVSPAVLEVLDNLGMSLRPRCRRKRPWQLWRWCAVGKELDASFVVFGPDYGAAHARRRLLGYADVTSVYPVPLGVDAGSLPARTKRAIRGATSRRLLLRATRVVVETEAFADAVRSSVPRITSPIDIVPNCINEAVFAHFPVARRDRGDLVRLLYVGRAYAHKNHDFLGRVGQELDKRGHRVEFAVTLSEDQWRARSALFRRYAVNLGELPVTRLHQAYADAHAVVFPSLLEAFSAAPLEGMAAGHVVFASDRDFVRTVCRDGAVYADPLDPLAWADVIEEWLHRPSVVEARILPAAAEVVTKLTRPRDRAKAYVRLIESELAQGYV